MFTKVVQICLAIVFLRDFGNANVAGLAFTCTAPPVYTGDRALVTCDFNVPVSTTRPAHFAVDFYPEGSTSPVEIAECTNLPDADLDCKAKRPGETFRITEEADQLVLEIDEATTNHSGRYMCKLSTPDIDQPQLEPCRFTVSASDGRRHSTKGYPSSSPSMGVTGSPVKESGVNWMIWGPAAGGGTVLIILLICLVIFVRKRRNSRQLKKSSDAEGKKGGNALLPQESPKPAPALLPTNAVLKTVREETDGQEETDSLVSETQEDQNEEEGAEKNETYERKRKGSTLSEEVEVVAAVRRIGVQQKLKNREFPWDGSVENLSRHMKPTENV